MAQGTILGQSGGIEKINGIIEEYIANGNIKTGDFVEFVNKFGIETEIEQLKNPIIQMKAVALSESKVAIFHMDNSCDAIKVVVCKITDNTISSESFDITIIDGFTNHFDVIALSENKVIIVYNKTSNLTLWGIICEFSENTIITGIDTKLAGTFKSGNYMFLTKLSENKIFITSIQDPVDKIFGILCEVNKTEINLLRNTQIAAVSRNERDGLSTIALSENKIAIFHSIGNTSSTTYLGCIICEISGSTITAGIDTRLSTEVFSGYYISAIALSENKVAVIHSNTNVRNICITLCKITNLEIEIIDEINIKDSYADLNMSVAKIAKNKLFILSHISENSYDYIVCNIKNNIVVEIRKELDQFVGNLKMCLTSKNKLLMCFYNNTFLEFKIYNLYKIQKVQNIIVGVAKTNGTEGQLVKVVTPEYEEEEEEN